MNVDGAVANERLASDTRLASTLPGVLPPLAQKTERVETQHLESFAAIERKKLDHGGQNSLSRCERLLRDESEAGKSATHGDACLERNIYSCYCRSLLEPIAENGTVILTVGNSGRRCAD